MLLHEHGGGADHQRKQDEKDHPADLPAEIRHIHRCKEDREAADAVQRGAYIGAGVNGVDDSRSPGEDVRAAQGGQIRAQQLLVGPDHIGISSKIVERTTVPKNAKQINR